MEHTPEEVEKEVARLFECATAPELLMPREALVDSTIQLLRDCNMVLIRAPPQTGKSTLAQLISRKVFTHHPDLEPVFFFWPAGRANYWEKIQDYREILKEQLNEKKVENESVREKLKIGTNVESSSRKPLYIIDDAHRTYSENLMWEQKFKNGIIDHDEYYLFLCGYGPANGHIHWGTVPSQSATVPTEWRIELLPHPSRNLQGMMQKEGYADTPHMLHVRMLEKEAAEVIKRWAENQSPQATYDSSVLELLWYETEGHPGALKLILELMESKGPMVTTSDTTRWTTGNPLRRHMVPLYPGRKSPSRSSAECSRLLEQSCQGQNCSRGFEFPAKFSWLKLTLQDIDEAVDMAATQPSGAWVEMLTLDDDEALKTYFKLVACERVGLLHSVDHEDWTQFIFASRFHQRVALQFVRPTSQPMASLPESNHTSPMDGGGHPTR